MAKEAVNTPLFTVSAPPHWHNGRSISRQMIDMLIALAPAAIMAIVSYGLPAARVMALAMATAVVVEFACLKVMQREITLDDFNAPVLGLMFAFLLPASAPWWLVVIGATITITLGKWAFGGLGSSPVAPPLVGWAALKISWITHMDVDASMLDTTLVNFTSQLKYFGAQFVSDAPLSDMFMGQQLSSLGSAQVAALLAGGIYLLVRGHIRWMIPVSFLAGVVGLSAIYFAIDPSMYASPVFQVLSGGVVFGAFFLATESGSSPVGVVPSLIYGAVTGALVIIIRTYGMYPDGIPFAIMLTNMCSPLFDLIKPKPFGAR